jgi:hypothetical protein
MFYPDQKTVLKNIQAEHFMSNLEESSTCRGLQLTHSYITRRHAILSASSEFGLLDWEHVLKDEIA